MRSFSCCRLPVRVETENCDLASAARTKPFQNLHRRGLARSVRSEQAKHFSRLDLEVDSFHSMDITIGLLEALH